MDAGELIDLGGSWTLAPISQNGERAGYMIEGPAAAECPFPYDGRCGGLVRTRDLGDGKPVWKILSSQPLTLDPSIRCSCSGQHGHVREGRYVPA
jgi:hypothetical protein